MQNTYQEKILDIENTNNSLREKLEGGIKFKIKSDFQPAGDQPQAIKQLLGNLKKQKKEDATIKLEKGILCMLFLKSLKFLLRF